jgi:hypothetical protein
VEREEQLSENAIAAAMAELRDRKALSGFQAESAAAVDGAAILHA